MTREPSAAVLTIDEVADWLGMHRNSVHRAARQGRLPARRVGKEWRFLRDAVAARWTPGRRLRGTAEVSAPEGAFPESPLELSALEAAEFLRVEPTTIYHEAAAERLPAWKEGHEWRTTASALREYLTSDPDPSGRYVRGGGDTAKK
jgi:excisionase family DNA binding protein